MKLQIAVRRRARIEILPLIDIVFLLLVFFIYAMLSMAVHRGLDVALPVSQSAGLESQLTVAVTLTAAGELFLDRQPVTLAALSDRLAALGRQEHGVLVFADRQVPYQRLFAVLDRIRAAGIERISLQAEATE